MYTTRTFNTPALIRAVIALYLGITVADVNFTGGTVNRTKAIRPLRSMDFIAKKYGTTTVSVRHALVSNGVEIRGRGRVAANA